MQQQLNLSRRGFLTAGAVALGASALAACGSSKSSATKTATKTKVRVAAADTTGSTGLDIRTMGYGASYVVMYHLFDSLAYLSTKGYDLGLATAITPNADATTWTIKITDKAKFHDGRPVRASDVAYTFTTLASDKSNRASVYRVIDTAKMTTPDDTTIVVPLKAARGDFAESVIAVFSPIVPAATTDFTKGIGSGPYKLAGQNSTTISLVRNDAYWGAKPTVDAIDIIRIADPAGRLSAVKSGQADYAVSISAVGAKASAADKSVDIIRGGAANSQALSFAMNSTLAPFDDPRVRQAVRLAADRSALITGALLGLGTEGDDVIGKGLAGYDDSLVQRNQDIAQAKSLFAAAGVTSLTLDTAELVPGMTNAARLLAQQLSAAGVTLKLNQIPPQAYYADLSALAKRPFQAFYYVNRPIAVHLAAVTSPGSTFNVTGLAQAWWTKLATAQAEPDSGKRETMFVDLQKYLYESGGDLIWGFQEELDVARPGLGGIQTVQSTPVFRTATVA